MSFEDVAKRMEQRDPTKQIDNARNVLRIVWLVLVIGGLLAGSLTLR
jgi:hypothetical protein